MIVRFRRFLAQLLIVSVAAMGLPAPASAGMLSTDAALAAADRGKITSFLERAEVRAQLQRTGVDPAQVQGRVAALTDEEAASLAQRIDALPAGGDAGLGAVLSVALIVFLVLLLTDILGYTHVFPFTKQMRR